MSMVRRQTTRILTRIWVCIAVLVAALGGAAPAAADSLGPIGFELPDYALLPDPSVDGQDDWESEGAAGSPGCSGTGAVYDHELAANNPLTRPVFGFQMLRVSNAVTSACLEDQTLSRPLTQEAGESSAVSGGFSGGTRQNVFLGEWQFATTVTTHQPGLSTVVSPERGDGELMSGIEMADSVGGVDLNFIHFERNGTSGDNDDFFSTPVASDLSRTAVHTIRLVIRFVDGTNMDLTANDVVQVFVDGVPVTIGASPVGKTWENFYREEESDEPRTVDSLLFHTSGTSAGASGNGFAIDNVRMISSTAGSGGGVTSQFPSEATPPAKPQVGRCSRSKTGTADADKLVGTNQGDRLKGKRGNDKLRGRAGDDCLRGGGQRDRLNGGSGADLLKGGAGDDAIYAYDDDKDRVRCGRGDDRATVDGVDTVKGCEDVL